MNRFKKIKISNYRFVTVLAVSVPLVTTYSSAIVTGKLEMRDFLSR